MTEKRATRRSCNYDRARVSTSGDYPIIPDWVGVVLGIGLGWPFLWWAVML